jgi:hypothetical protein
VPSALRKTCPDSLTIEKVKRSEQLSQNILIFAPFLTDHFQTLCKC